MTDNSKNTITPSDWIVFLQGEISHTVGFMFPFCTILLIMHITLVQINLSFGSELFPMGLEEITIALLFLVIFFAVMIAWSTRPLGKLCRRIVEGKLTTHEKILKEYEKIRDRNRLYRIKKSKEIPINKKHPKKNQKNIKKEGGKADSDKPDWKDDPSFVKYNK